MSRNFFFHLACLDIWMETFWLWLVIFDIANPVMFFLFFLFLLVYIPVLLLSICSMFLFIFIISMLWISGKSLFITISSSSSFIFYLIFFLMRTLYFLQKLVFEVCLSLFTTYLILNKFLYTFKICCKPCLPNPFFYIHMCFFSFLFSLCNF